MKKSLLLLLLCTGILTGCGNQALPAEPTETSTVSQTTSAVQAEEQSTTTTTTITEGIPEVTETCSEVISSVTTVTETNTATEEILNDTESTTTTASVPEEEFSEAESITSKPTVTNKVTTTTKADTEPTVTTKVTTTRTSTTTTAKPVTTTTKTTTTTTVTTPSGPVITNDNLYGYYFDISDKLNDPVLDWTKVTLQVGLFIEQYPIDYQEMYEKGATFTGSDLEKARAILNYAYSLGGQNCIEYALNAYFLYQGAGLHAEITFESYNEWYGHVANVVKIDGQWMAFDASAGKYSINSYSTIKAFDIYENTVIIQ
ncbi:MAG: hypothetical protein IKI94_00435 [Ruminococcus sp.]|nr:hypothetical protein [Ruminococcus sp.]